MGTYRLEGSCIRCGACCRPPTTFGGIPCPHFRDGVPAVCLLEKDKPFCCRDWPADGSSAVSDLEPGCGYRYVVD